MERNEKLNGAVADPSPDTVSRVSFQSKYEGGIVDGNLEDLLGRRLGCRFGDMTCRRACFGVHRDDRKGDICCCTPFSLNEHSNKYSTRHAKYINACIFGYNSASYSWMTQGSLPPSEVRQCKRQNAVKGHRGCFHVSAAYCKICSSTG